MLFFGKSKKQKEITPAPAATMREQAVAPLVLSTPPQDAPTSARPGNPRNARRPAGDGKTRLMGFDTSDGRVVDLFEDEAETAQTGRCSFPVGWVLITDGPGKGECFAIQSGMSQIGRGEDQAVRLDFGDMAISRSNHAAIVYDPQKHTFLLGHGGKANLVRLNGSPVVATHNLSDGDEIVIGETRLRFKALCSAQFNWTEAEEQGDEDDVEIA